MSENTAKIKTTPTIRFIDLFCGIGGTRLGLEQACKELNIKSECILSSDKKKSAQKAYKDNFKEEILGDIKQINEKDIPDFDFLLAGFPCQPFSRAGKKGGFNDTRGTMFFEIERILKEKKPKYVLLENVPEITTNNKGNTIRVIRENLEKIGYDVSIDILDATDFGLAQARKRAFIVGIMKNNDDKNKQDIVFTNIRKTKNKRYIKDIKEKDIKEEPTPYIKAILKNFSPDELAGAIISDKRRGTNTIHSWDFGLYGEVSEKEKEILETILTEHRKRKYADELNIKWRDGMPLNLTQVSRALNIDENDTKSISELEKTLNELVSKGYLMTRHPYCDDSLEERLDLPVGWKLCTSRVAFEIHRILDDNDVCITLTATDCNHIGIVDGKNIRKLNVRECLRLFGFPDTYTLNGVSKKEAYDLIGNSICVPVVSAVAKQMLIITSKNDENDN